MPPRRICSKCEKQLTDAANAMRRHASLMTTTISVVQSGSMTETQRQQFQNDLVATFDEAQSAWDAYRDHLTEHGWLPSKT